MFMECLIIGIISILLILGILILQNKTLVEKCRKIIETFTNPLNITLDRYIKVDAKKLSCQQMRNMYDITTGESFGIAPENVRLEYVRKCSGIAPNRWMKIVKGGV